MEAEIKSWIESVLKKENIKNVKVDILGNSEKGDNYMGDVVFANANGTAEDNSSITYNLVIKCSKRSEALRNQMSINEIFMNEIFVYETVLPTFKQFELDRGIQDYFCSVPKYYGHFANDNVEVLILENLKQAGYEMWDKTKPMTRAHLDMVVTEYAKFHSTAMALKTQEPKIFESISQGFANVVEIFNANNESTTLYENAVQEISDVLKGEVEEGIILKLHKLKDEVGNMFSIFGPNTNETNVVLHGDCWNNNFMFISDKNNLPKSVSILDWQMATLGTPIADLSYFLFCCIGEENLKLESFLDKYYQAFAHHLRRLGSDPDTLYSFNTFVNEWKNYSKFGLICAFLIHKVCATEKDDVADMGQIADKGQNWADTFSGQFTNKANLIARVKPIVLYVERNHLI